MKLVDDVEKFMLSLLRKWDASNYDIRVHIFPLKQLSTCIKADEYGDIQWMLEHMDILAERLAQQNPSLKNGTVESYASRAKRAIREYLSWDKSPDTYPGWRCKKVKKKERKASRCNYTITEKRMEDVSSWERTGSDCVSTTSEWTACS